MYFYSFVESPSLTWAKNVAALTRPSSASKPDITALRSRGVEIRVGDYTTDPPAKIAEYLQGVDTLLSTITAEAIPAQKPIFKAAFDAGVKRIIPCDFGTPGVKGVRDLHDVVRPVSRLCTYRAAC